MLCKNTAFIANESKFVNSVNYSEYYTLLTKGRIS